MNEIEKRMQMEVAITQVAYILTRILEKAEKLLDEAIEEKRQEQERQKASR